MNWFTGEQMPDDHDDVESEIDDSTDYVDSDRDIYSSASVSDKLKCCLLGCLWSRISDIKILYIHKDTAIK